MAQKDNGKIPNSILYYGMPMTGKSTRLQKIYLQDLKQSKGKVHDLAINLWQYYHRTPQWARRGTTSNFIQSPHGVIPALALPFDPKKWEMTLQQYHNQFPNVKHILIDECYCINWKRISSAVLLTTLVMCCRDYWPHAQVIMGSIDFDSWHHRMSNINILRKMAVKSIHLNHKCVLDYHRVATRRLHIIKTGKSTWTPFYNQIKYNRLINKPKYRRKATMISVCSRHYRLSKTQLNQLMKMTAKKRHQPTWHFVLRKHMSPVQKQAIQQIKRNNQHRQTQAKQNKSKKRKKTHKTRKARKPRKITKKHHNSTKKRKHKTKRTKKTEKTKHKK